MARMFPLLAALVVLVSCDGSDSMDPESGGGQIGQIAFSVNRVGWNEIWLMQADGTGRTRLSELEPPETGAAGSTSPAWSPDGRQIAFAAQIGTREEDQRTSEIYVMNADGTDRRRLTTNDELDSSPSWSPDGERIAFTRLAEPGTAAAHGGLFVMDADGDGEVQITRAESPFFDFGPAWSPDGTTIAFTRAEPNPGSSFPKPALYAVTPEGGELRKLTSDGDDPHWSPDGERIVFTSVRDSFGRTCFHECGTSAEIYVLEVDGGRERRLTESEADDSSPAWSPDGRLIAFASDRSNPEEHEIEIYVMEATGGDVRRITKNDVWDREPAWRP